MSLKVRIRAFKAIEDLESCQMYAEGHYNVLRDFGVTKVTSANNDWFYNPSVYAIMVESVDGTEAYGGARIHLTGGTQPLPMEDAVGGQDPKVIDIVKPKSEEDTYGELCGLWNSRKVSGSGYPILLTKACVAKAGVAIANQLNLKKLFVLCAPYTVSMVEEVGFELITTIGNNGTFTYPNEHYLATALVLNDTEKLKRAVESSRERILNLRNNPIQNQLEHGPKGDMEIDYDLIIPGLG